MTNFATSFTCDARKIMLQLNSKTSSLGSYDAPCTYVRISVKRDLQIDLLRSLRDLLTMSYLRGIPLRRLGDGVYVVCAPRLRVLVGLPARREHHIRTRSTETLRHGLRLELDGRDGGLHVGARITARGALQQCQELHREKNEEDTRKKKILQSQWPSACTISRHYIEHF